MRTRAKTRQQLIFNLPCELWVLILSRLDAADISRAVCTSTLFAEVRDDVWHAAARRRWPNWCEVSAGTDVWKRAYELFQQREQETLAIVDIARMESTQMVVSVAQHRPVLAEWLQEVIGVAGQRHHLSRLLRVDPMISVCTALSTVITHEQGQALMSLQAAIGWLH